MISTLEIAANLVTTVSIVLAGRNSVHTWWTGIIGCALFTLVFYQSQLYADVVLQLFFVITSAMGWWQWLHGMRGHALTVAGTSRALLAGAIFIGIATTIGYGALLHGLTDAYAPFVDSAVLAFSVIAQLMLMQRKRETWLFWIVVNSIAIPLYASRDLLLTSALYGVYWVNALVSWFAWRRVYRTQTLGAGVAGAS